MIELLAFFNFQSYDETNGISRIFIFLTDYLMYFFIIFHIKSLLFEYWVYETSNVGGKYCL